MLFLHVALSSTQQLHRSGAFKLDTGDETGNFYLHFFVGCQGIQSSSFAGRTGIAILTSNYHFYVANNVEEVRSRRYYDPPGKKIIKFSVSERLIMFYF